MGCAHLIIYAMCACDCVQEEDKTQRIVEQRVTGYAVFSSLEMTRMYSSFAVGTQGCAFKRVVSNKKS